MREHVQCVGLYWKIFSAAASSAITAVSAAGRERATVKADQLPPVTVTSPEARPLKRVARPKPAQIVAQYDCGPIEPARRKRQRCHARCIVRRNRCAAADRRQRRADQRVNAVPFLRAGEALEVSSWLVPGTRRSSTPMPITACTLTTSAALALVTLAATHSRGRRRGGTGWWGAGSSCLRQDAGANGRRSPSVAGGRRVVAYTDGRVRCGGIHAVKRLANSPTRATRLRHACMS